MAKFGQTNIMVGGGGSSDECTAKLSDIPEGLTAITSDSNDEPGRGTMRLTGTADPNEVLQGEIFYSTDYKKKQIGTMINGNIPDPKIGGINDTYPEVGIQRGTGAQFSMTTVSKEKLFAISPEKDGYFAKGNGYIGIPANELGLANPFQVLQGCTFTSAEGINIAGQMTVNSIMSFELAGVSGRQILFQWRNPTPASGKPYSSIFINYSTSGYPGTGGTRLYTGWGNNNAPGGLSQVWIDLPALGTTYYFSAYAYAQVNSGNNDIYGPEFRAVGTTGGVMTNTYTYSQNVTVPAGFTQVDIFCVGGGSGGTGGSTASSNHNGDGGAGGGGGYTNSAFNLTVSAGQILSVSIGSGGRGGNAGGTGADDPGQSGTNGGITSVSRSGSVLCSANGGNGRNGGSGGGQGAPVMYTAQSSGGNGGSNGSNGFGSNNSTMNGGTGQGRTTTAFSENWGTLYAAGGAGGSSGNIRHGDVGGNYGGGNGGNGMYKISSSSEGTNWQGAGVGGSATASTGSGGGGGGGGIRGGRRQGAAGGNGASGVVLIRFK